MEVQGSQNLALAQLGSVIGVCKDALMQKKNKIQHGKRRTAISFPRSALYEFNKAEPLSNLNVSLILLLILFCLTTSNDPRFSPDSS